MECVGHHRKRPNPSDTDYYEPCQNTPEDNHDACSLPHVLEFTVAMRRFEELSRTAPWRRLLPSPVSEIAHEDGLSCQSGLSTRAEALPDDADMRWRRAKRTAAMGGLPFSSVRVSRDQREAPIRGLGQNLGGRRSDNAGLAQPYRIEPDRVIGIVPSGYPCRIEPNI